MLKRLTLYGFKTFAKKTEIDFIDGITCIVGPNGSGKSNIADSLRWVLGEHGMKSLRSDKLTEVIFAGSDYSKPLNLAEVVLLLENKSEIFPLKYSEIEITRRIYRDNKSEYFINRNACRLKDIQEIFLDTGLGKGGISMIGQGQVEKIISADPSERRALFEETAGINKYQHRKQAALKKIESTQNNLLRLSDIIQEIEGRLGPLKKEVNRLSRYKRYEERTVKLERELLLIEYFALQKREEEAVNHLNKAIEDVEGIKSDLLKMEDNHKSILSGMKDLDVNLEKQEDIINNLKVELDILRGKCHSYFSRREELKERLSGMINLKASLEEQIGKIQESIKNDEERLENLRLKSDELKKEIETKELAYNKESEELKYIRNQYTLCKEKSLTCNQKVSGATKELNNLTIVYEELKRDIFRLKEAISEKNRSASEFTRSRQENENSLKDLGNEEKDINDIIRDLKDEKEQLLTSIEKKRIELANLYKSFSKKEIRLNLLKELEKDFEGYFPGVKAIMVAKEKSRDLSGVIGILGSLIKVPEVYEKAIEVALGGHIQDIVTRTDGDAKLCVEYLRKTQRGRATFLPLNLIRSNPFNPYGEGGWEKDHKVLGQASKLIDFDSPYKSVIDYLLSHYYIVSDLNAGTELLKRYNLSATLVTLEGDIIRPAGAITGGSLNNKKGSLLSRTREMEDLALDLLKIKKEKDLLEVKEKEFNDRLKNAEKELKEKGEELSLLTQKKARLQRDKDRLFLEEKQLKEKIEEFQTNLDKNTAKSKDVDISTGKLQREIEKLREDGLVYEREGKILEDKLSHQEKEEIKILNILTEIKMEHATTVETVNNLSSFIINSRGQLKQLKTNYTSCSGELKNLEDRLISMDREEKEDNLKASSLEFTYEEAMILFNKLEEQKKEKDEKKDRLDKNISSVRDDLYKKEELRNELHVTQARISTEKDILKARIPEICEPEFTEPEKISQELEMLKNRINEMGFVNYNAELEYEEVNNRYHFLLEQKADMEEAVFSLYKIIEDSDKKSRSKFKETFDKVAIEFSALYSNLFPGGKAYLNLTDEADYLKSGIDIIINPPGKKLQSISLLSGGEKTMAALVLLLSIFKVKPTPFCVFDEVDAALDDNNTFVFAKCLKEFSQKSQFIVISHNKITMEQSDVIYGITMEEPGVSEIISMKLGDPALEHIISKEVLV